MIRMKYNENKKPIIYILATPIGNLKEINQRFTEILNQVEYILCEDTRVSQKLLNHLEIKNKDLISYHEHNEFDKLNEAITLAKKHQAIALISDAGYPLLSDPGELLVRKALEEDVNVVVVNGSNALLPALISSGFATIPFTFIGFLPKKSNDAKKELLKYQEYKHTLVLYETIHQLQKTLKLIIDTFGDVDISISREISKLNEEHIYGKASEILYSELELKGELVLCINNVIVSNNENIVSDDDIIAGVNIIMEEGTSRKNAIKEVSKKYGLEKNYVYNLVHKK